MVETFCNGKMDTECNYFYDKLLPEEGVVAVRVLGSDVLLNSTQSVSHVLANGTVLKSRKKGLYYLP